MSQLIEFGPFLLDPENESLAKHAEPVPLRPKAIALLIYLARRPAELATKESLLDALWPGVHVSDAALKVAIGELRRVLGDPPRSPKLIETVHRRGYRFIAQTSLVEGAPGGLRAPETRIEVNASGSANDGADAAPSSHKTSSAQSATAQDLRAPAARGVMKSQKFVGRQDALSVLDRTWQTAATGRTQFALISGAAGIGKTSLVEEFAHRISDREPLLVTARSTDRDGVPGFWLWTQVLRTLTEEPSLQDEIRGLATLPEVAPLMPGFALIATAASPRPPPTDAPSPDQRFFIFDAIAQSLRACAKRRPLVLFLEDLQWAGPPSLRFLDNLACELRDAPLLVVATLRDEPRAADHPASQTAALLRQQDCSETIELEGFSIDEVRTLFASAVGHPAPDELSAELFRRTEGVPFFVSEAIRFLDQHGDLAQQETQNIQLPKRASDLLSRALDTLTTGGRHSRRSWIRIRPTVFPSARPPRSRSSTGKLHSTDSTKRFARGSSAR